MPSKSTEKAELAFAVLVGWLPCEICQQPVQPWEWGDMAVDCEHITCAILQIVKHRDFHHNRSMYPLMNGILDQALEAYEACL